MPARIHGGGGGGTERIAGALAVFSPHGSYAGVAAASVVAMLCKVKRQ